MFEKSHVPAINPQLQQFLTNLYAHTSVTADQKAVIDKKVEKADQIIKEKIANTITISEYFDQLWSQSELKEADKDFVIRKLETVQQNKKLQIKSGEQNIAKTPADLNVVNDSFKMTPYEEFNFQEKLKELRKRKNVDLDKGLTISASHIDLDVLHALNRPYKSAQHASTPSGLHYTAGLYDENEADHIKIQKAEEFVKKIKDDKKVFMQKIKQIEQVTDEKNNQGIERLKDKESKEEEIKQKEKKDRLDAHIKELKARSEVRIKDQNQWEEDYKKHQGRRPMFREIQDNYKKGHVIPELEERKRKLAEIRDFHRPIQREEIAEHERKILRALEEKSKKKEEANSSQWIYKKPDFESKYHRLFAEEVAKTKRQKEEEHMEKLKRKERVMEHIQMVKENHIPRVDPEKELELMTLVDKLKAREKRDHRSRTVDEEEDPDTYNESKKKGDEYLQSVKELVRKRRDMTRTVKDGQPSEKRNELATERDNKQTSNSLKTDISALKKHNYLVDLRRENKLNSNANPVDLIIKNKKLDDGEKRELLQSEIQKLEEKAKRQELIKKYKKDFQGDDEMDQMYINAIKAKLEMLGS